jgi:rfaE bifunctional protein kinase chain/domain
MHSKEQLRAILESFKSQHVIVIGDTIIDEYRHCDALGKSSEAPVLVLKELDKQRYIGGAGVVAGHVMALGAKCTFFTVLGVDRLGNEVAKQIESYSKIVWDEGRSTTFKKRYMVENQKLLRVSRLDEHYISEELEKELLVLLEYEIRNNKIDSIIISDFNYGVVTDGILKRVRELAFEYGISLIGDTQSSSQIGNVIKFQNYDLITPNEKEARIALKDEHSSIEDLIYKLHAKTFATVICLTRGRKGFVTYHNRVMGEYSTLNPNPVDAMGAGDALLAAMALCYSATNVWDASEIAQVMAGLKVSKIGNVPITAEELYSEMEKRI